MIGQAYLQAFALTAIGTLAIGLGANIFREPIWRNEPICWMECELFVAS